MKDKYKEELKYFLDMASKKRRNADKEYPNESNHLDFYLLHSKEELKLFINEYLKTHKVNNDYDFYYMMSSIIKYMSGNIDAHTKVVMPNNNYYPITFRVIDNKVYIYKCNDSNFNLKELKNINGIDINIIIREIEQRTCYGTKNYFLNRLENTLNDKNILISLPSMDSDIKYIEYGTDEGSIKYEVDGDYKKDNYVYKTNGKKIDIRDRTLIFRYPACRKEYIPNIEKIKDIIDKQNIDSFIFDIRGNSGGDSSLIRPLINYLNNTNLKLITLVDRGVFSSGRFAIIDMQNIGSIIVGEDIGTPINCFGYVFCRNTLPNTKFNFNFSRVYWYLEDKKMKGIYTKEELLSKDKIFFEPQYLKIDYYINLSLDDYKTDRDVMLNKCCEFLKKIELNR